MDFNRLHFSEAPFNVPNRINPFTEITGPYQIGYRVEPFVPVDYWTPRECDIIFRPERGSIFVPISSQYGMNDLDRYPINAFYLNTKRCYNNMRDHIAKYLNYFERFYDIDKELWAIYTHMKYKMDIDTRLYTADMFIDDLKLFILNTNSTIFKKADQMNEENYCLTLAYKNNRNPVLQYTEVHAKVMMRASLLMNMVIPLITHFMFVSKMPNCNSNKFISDIFVYILDNLCGNINISSKLYETATTNINKNANDHARLWEMQPIRGISPETHSKNCVENIVVSIMPKYEYKQNIIHFNYKSIINNTRFQITDISYEYTFVSLSSAKRDEDNNSEFDKFESYQTKDSEAKFLTNHANYELVMRELERMWGPFDPDELAFINAELSRDDIVQCGNEFTVIPDHRSSIRELQKGFIFLLFYKKFGDPISLREINRVDYIKMIVMARRILQSWGLVSLSYIFTSRFETGKVKALNIREKARIETHNLYPNLLVKYSNNLDCINRVLDIIGFILASKFTIIDYYHPELNGQEIPIYPDNIIDEVMLFALKI